MTLDKDNVAVVTGAASGIGFAIAAALGARDLKVCLLDVEAAALERAAGQLRAQGTPAEPFVCDVSDAEAVTSVAQAILQQHGQVDLLVNNAGVGGLLTPIWDSPPQDWAWVFGVNLFGVVNGIRAFTPAMLARGCGHILNVASMAGLTAPPFLATYTTSKHAVVALTESLAAELAAAGSAVRTSVACPGNVESSIREADRNRPPSLAAASSAAPETLAKLHAVFASLMAEGQITANEAAERILDGAERGELHILTHPAQVQPARDRLARLAAALDAA